jgi:predicted dehydrogenase
MKQINIGLIGCGLLGNMHMMCLQSIIEEEYFAEQAEIRIVAVCDIKSDHVKEYAKQQEVKYYYTDYRELLKNPDVNTVYIVTPTAFHKEMYLAALQAGMDIFLEKLVTDPPTEIENMIQAREKAGKITQVGLVLRNDPLFWYTRQIFTTPENQQNWGKLQNVIFRDDQQKPYTGTGSHPSTWRRDPQLAFHGTLFEHSIHDIDILQFLCGPITETHARVKFFAGITDIEDSVCASFELTNGSSAALTSIWHNVNHDLRHFEFFFENAIVFLDFGGLSGEITIQERGSKVRKISYKEADEAFRKFLGIADHPPFWLQGYGYENIAFIRSLLSQSPAIPGLEEALDAHRIVEACYQSSKTKTNLLIERNKK